MNDDAGGLLDNLSNDDHDLSDDGTEIAMPEIVDSDSRDDEDPYIIHEVRLRLARHQGQEENKEVEQGGGASDCCWRDCGRKHHRHAQ